MRTEEELGHAWEALKKAGWLYRGCDFWEDPVDGVKRPTGNAYEVQLQREKERGRKLILCSDFRKIEKELQRQLGPFRVTVKFHHNYKKWGDQIWVEVKPVRNLDYEKYMKWCDKKGIDPWNCFS